MCLAIPGIVEEIYIQDAITMAKVNFQGIKRSVCLAYLTDINIGDYVLVHVGFALKKLSHIDFINANKLINVDSELN